MTDSLMQIEVKFGEDSSGARVLREIKYFYPDDTVPLGGIGARDIRNISLWGLLKEDYKDSGYSLPAEDEDRLFRLVRDSYPSKPGRVPIPEIYLASISYFYDKNLRSNPQNPNSVLAAALGVPHRTMVGRVKKARSLGLISVGEVSPRGGRARGSLTDKSIKIIQKYLSAQK